MLKLATSHSCSTTRKFLLNPSSNFIWMKLDDLKIIKLIIYLGQNCFHSFLFGLYNVHIFDKVLWLTSYIRELLSKYLHKQNFTQTFLSFITLTVTPQPKQWFIMIEKMNFISIMFGIAQRSCPVMSKKTFLPIR